MNPSTSTETLLAIPFLTSLSFWRRGSLRGSKGDLLLGVLLLILATFLTMIFVDNSGFVSFIGRFLVLFGIVSILMRRHAAEKEVMSKSDVTAIAILLIVLGLLGSMVV